MLVCAFLFFLSKLPSLWLPDIFLQEGLLWWHNLQKENDLKNGDDLKNEDELKKEDDFKNEVNIKNEDDLKMKMTSKIAPPSKFFWAPLPLKNYLKFFWWLLTVTATPQLMLNRKWYQGSKPEMEFHMMNIIYAALSISAQTEKTTFSCKDDCTLTKYTGRWTYSARDFEIPLCHTPPLRSFFSFSKANNQSPLRGLEFQRTVGPWNSSMLKSRLPLHLTKLWQSGVN